MTQFTPQDERFMRRALELAAQGLGQTRPNPVVGAVLVKGGRILAEGWHKAAGKPHAEVEAIRRAGNAARGATLYVSLEPCCHHGRTPPCTDLILRTGVRRVVIPFADPNPLVSRKGIEQLRTAHVRVDVGLLAHDAAHLNEAFLTYHLLKRPFFIAKWAMTLDGRLASFLGDSKWITNESSRRYVHELRARYDAVMVGVGTVLADDPQLNVRLPDRRKVIQPARIIVDSRLATPLKAKCLDGKNGGPTIVATTQAASTRRIALFRKRGITVLVVPADECKRVDLEALAGQLHDAGIQSVLAEGGSQMLTSLFTADLVDRVAAFVAPRIIGGFEEDFVLRGAGWVLIGQGPQLEDVVIRQFGDDVCIEGYVHHGVGRQEKERIFLTTDCTDFTD